MKPNHFLFPHPRHHEKQGVALVIVLAGLVLLVGLVMAFFVSVTGERATAQRFEDSVSSQLLVDTAVNSVIGQIRQATSNSDLAWASQPGAIRTYTPAGSLDTLYKLYSSSAMQINTANGMAADLPPDNWASVPAEWTDLNEPVKVVRAGAQRTFYPIVDPDAEGLVEGFALESPPGATADQPLPMPTRWIYVLRDGQLTTSSGTGPTPSDANPIVGRVAFWTDDDTAKVNINTAAGGEFWDTPRANTNQERLLAQKQPAQREWQRYAGHPATTDLRAVFPSLSFDQLYSIIPRVQGGGSDGGAAIASQPIDADTDRLYANPDEILLDKERVTNSGLTEEDIARTRFFLTAHSRAPELNLFNMPRIAIWPIFKGLNSNRVTGFDRLIARNATINGQPYYFQRENAMSPTNDIQIPRNLQLYDYLSDLTSEAVPGFGGNFSTKYGADRDQILTQIFDYIRSSNLYDDLLGLNSGFQFTPGRDPGNPNDPAFGHGWVLPTVYDPSGSNPTMGYGRAFGISEVAIGFICRAAADDLGTVGTDESEGSNTNANPAIGAGGTLLAANEKIVQALLISELFSVMQGWTAIRPDMEIQVSGLKNLKLLNNSGNPTDLYPSDTATISYTGVAGAFHHGRHWGGNPAWRFAARTDAGSANPLISNSIRIDTTSGSMDFTGGQLVFELRGKSSGQIFQRVAVDLPSAAFPIPLIASSGTSDNNNPTTKENWWDMAQRVGRGSSDPGKPSARLKGAILREEFDVVRSVIPSHGDFRLVCARFQPLTGPIGSDPAFVKHPDYDDLTKRVACGLAHSAGTDYDLRNDPAVAPTDQRFFTDLMPNTNRIQDIPRNASARPDTTGDFDTGVSLTIDGPYINKPDEGNNYRGNGSGIPYFNESNTQNLGGATFFSPNRIMPSPGMFGSLPTRVKVGTPWQTLLFRPQTTYPAHSTTIPDHLMMDLFWMPVVEPYSISEPFSTAGKINMNYQIQPFTYITRATGLHALLRSEKVAAIPDAKILDYKTTKTNNEFRQSINIAETLSQFQTKFDTGEIYRSATEICDIHIVPEGQTAAGMPTFWTTHRVTGDNLRERIYTTLYPRLTTKSNTFTVHYRVQTLKKVPGTDVAVWDEARDQVVGEFRGSTTIERFIDPNDANIPDYASANNLFSEDPPLPGLDTYYQFRIIGTRQFSP